MDSLARVISNANTIESTERTTNTMHDWIIRWKWFYVRSSNANCKWFCEVDITLTNDFFPLSVCGCVCDVRWVCGGKNRFRIVKWFLLLYGIRMCHSNNIAHRFNQSHTTVTTTSTMRVARCERMMSQNHVRFSGISNRRNTLNEEICSELQMGSLYELKKWADGDTMYLHSVQSEAERKDLFGFFYLT